MPPSARLDELVIEALVVRPPPPVGQFSSFYAMFEIIRDDDDDLVATNRFVRFSAPYERIELDAKLTEAVRRARPTTFVRTVRAPVAQAAATVSFDKQWFEQPDDVIASLDDRSVEPATSWRWLAISVAIAGAAIAAVLL